MLRLCSRSWFYPGKYEMVKKSWFNAVDGGPTLNQHLINTSDLPGLAELTHVDDDGGGGCVTDSQAGGRLSGAHTCRFQEVSRRPGMQETDAETMQTTWLSSQKHLQHTPSYRETGFFCRTPRWACSASLGRVLVEGNVRLLLKRGCNTCDFCYTTDFLEPSWWNSNMGIYWLTGNSAFNSLTAKLFNLNFHPLEVDSRWRDPQLQVSENYSDLTKLGVNCFQILLIDVTFDL